ncbi:MAG TPA: M20/M25/M40 family metallo-hydrolase [Gemmatimonadales bacterium]|nr:M20/M25/M40 family metallo-hydrolase [Gemmatimonadales bacterium]
MHRFLALVAILCLQSRLHAQSTDPRIQAIVDSISPERLGATIRSLAGFETRNLLSDTVSTTRGIGAARRWIFEQLKAASPRLQVSFDEYTIPPAGRVTREVLLKNVMAVLPGKSPRRLYVCGHYDTIARNADGTFQGGDDNRLAPGANDDGSGTALVMELARVIARSGIEFDATIVFIALAGEEQGLIGGAQHAKKAAADSLVIDGVFNNDIVGGSVGGQGRVDSRTVRVYSEGPEDSPSRSLARYIRDVAARYVPAHEVRLIARHDRFGRGGDHSAFNQAGYTGVRFTEAQENYSRQHTVNDTPDGVDPAYLARNARVNAAGLVSLAIAPAAPKTMSTQGRPLLGRGDSGYDATLRWTASADAKAYRVVWREGWAADWQYSRTVTDTTLVLRDLTIDDYVFGVAAIGPGGHESLVSAYVLPPRR